MTPILFLVFGVTPVTAVGTDLWFAALTKLVATRVHHSAGLIDWGVVKLLWIGSLPAAALTVAAMKMGWVTTRFDLLRMAIAGAVLIQPWAYFFSRGCRCQGGAGAWVMN
jgi:uncharacterized membrane protein YfcA